MANAETQRARARAWSVANPDRKRFTDSAWRVANPGRVTAAVRAYKQRKRNAVPSWANEFFIAESYDIAAKRTAMTGIPWEVDHIVPLQSATVCGLHVENNLAVITAKDNRKKGNRRWPDMP